MPELRLRSYLQYTHPRGKSPNTGADSTKSTLSFLNHIISASSSSNQIIYSSFESCLPIKEVPCFIFEALFCSVDKCRVLCHSIYPGANYLSFTLMPLNQLLSLAYTTWLKPFYLIFWCIKTPFNWVQVWWIAWLWCKLDALLQSMASKMLPCTCMCTTVIFNKIYISIWIALSSLLVVGIEIWEKLVVWNS